MTGHGTEAVVRAQTLGRPAFAALLALFIAVGALGLYSYVWNFWLYRGYAPPTDPAFVTQAGTTTTFDVASPALGGRHQQVLVYLPPGYASHAHRRYPVLYLLHGFPGRPAAFLRTVRMGVVEDVLVAEHRAQPLILAMPFGSTGTFTDKEWANGYRPGESWETFVARDVVHAVDARFRTVRSGAGRALAGLSEGGYAALNIGLHHPGEFRVLESWSGYETADNLKSIFGGEGARLSWNSPNIQLPRVAPALRRAKTYIWVYSGTTDRLRQQNALFARALQRFGIRHRYSSVRGGHDWALWRGNAARAYLAASRHLHA
ncbi:MAG: alpha/beta hydrolase [Gaiellaceae bacterium]